MPLHMHAVEASIFQCSPLQIAGAVSFLHMISSRHGTPNLEVPDTGCRAGMPTDCRPQTAQTNGQLRHWEE
jgi:hypothetical protein